MKHLRFRSVLNEQNMIDWVARLRVRLVGHPVVVYQINWLTCWCRQGEMDDLLELEEW